MKSFRKNHILKILRDFQGSSCPIDLFIHQYFKSHHALGSNDRKEIAEFIYRFIRWKGLADYFTSSNLEEKIDWFIQHDPKMFCFDTSIPLHIRLSFPKLYIEALKSTLTEEQIITFCLESNEKAPTTIRINPIKTTREFLFNKLKENFDLIKCPISPYGIQIIGKANLFQTPEFKEGLFEMQDEASQLASLMVKASAKDAVLDFCCGAGGKTLGFAHLLSGQGQIYIHDVRESAINEAKKRLKRAGIQNYQILHKNSSNWKSKRHKMDWILIDAPCSGSGTLRRNPDQKWKFNPEMIPELVLLQKNIFDEALQFLAPKGKIVYATCSIFKEENSDQITYFCQKYNLKVIGDTFSSLPKAGQMDGFFAATLEKL